MIEKPMDVLHQYPVRKSGKQKKSFREDVTAYAKTLGYETSVEKGFPGCKNVIIGNPEKAKYIITAHYDTPARLPFPNLVTPCNLFTFIGYQILQVLMIVAIILPLVAVVAFLSKNLDITIRAFGLFLIGFCCWMMFGPANKNNANDNTSGVVTVLEIAKNLPDAYRDQVCFVLFDMEEQGLFGSSAYASQHRKQVKNQLILNMDCVGDGDELLMVPNSKVKKNPQFIKLLRSIAGSNGCKTLVLREKGVSIYPSDQANFANGVAFSAMQRSKCGILYCDKIHTPKDTILEEENVRMISDSICNALTGSSENHAKEGKIHE